MYDRIYAICAGLRSKSINWPERNEELYKIGLWSKSNVLPVRKFNDNNSSLLLGTRYHYYGGFGRVYSSECDLSIEFSVSGSVISVQNDNDLSRGAFEHTYDARSTTDFIKGILIGDGYFPSKNIMVSTNGDLYRHTRNASAMARPYSGGPLKVSYLSGFVELSLKVAAERMELLKRIESYADGRLPEVPATYCERHNPKVIWE
jgi:hypothetical protein